MAPKSKLLGPGTLKIGATGTETEWAGQLRKTELKPDIKEGDTLPVLSGDTIDDPDEITWTLGGTILQDYDNASLELWAFENQGQWLPFTFTPNTTATTSWTGEVKVQPLGVGGDVGQRATSDFQYTARNVTPKQGPAKK